MRLTPNYIELYKLLKKEVNYHEEAIPIDSEMDLYNFDFKSNNIDVLPDQIPMNEDSTNPVLTEINIDDSHIIENQQFRYHIFHPKKNQKAKEVILMFHGLNEKYWTKYLPWAKRLADLTGKTIVLFPIAFHMNRAPHRWSERRIMQPVSEQRKKTYPEIVHSTLSNVAISTRLHTYPQRLFWSGLQTYYDVIQLLDEFKAGKNPIIDPDAEYDIFSYSIGCLLAEILIMTNHKDYFKKSRLCMFCGGVVFNRLSPVSKFILDSEANVALYSYVVEHLENHLRNEHKLRHYLNDLSEGINFKSMINYKVNLPLREEIFNKLSDRMMAIGLVKDTVIPPYEIINTLQGSLRNIPVKVEILDFPYKYKHEDPFPVAINHIADEVNEEFEKFMKMVANFLK